MTETGDFWIWVLLAAVVVGLVALGDGVRCQVAVDSRPSETLTCELLHRSDGKQRCYRADGGVVEVAQ